MNHFLGGKIDFVTIDPEKCDLPEALGCMKYKPEYVEKDGCIYLDDEIFPSKRCLDAQIFSNRIKIGLVGDAALHRVMPKYKTSASIEDLTDHGKFRDAFIKSSNGEINYEGDGYSFFMKYTNLIFQEIEADLSKYWDEIILLANALIERKTLNGKEVKELMAKFGHNPIPLEVQMEEWKDIMEKEALGLPVDSKF